MRQISGKVALVTGAAKGLGRAIAFELAKRGASLYLADIDGGGLEGTARDLAAMGTRVYSDVCDVSQMNQIDAAVETVRRQVGCVDILVNNAGISVYAPAPALTQVEWDRVLAVNLLAPVRFVNHFLSDMLKLPEAHILNICSIMGLLALPKQSPYHTSKFGLVGFSESLRIDLARTNVGVTALCPGPIDTHMLSDTEQKGPRGEKRCEQAPKWLLASPESVAKRAVRAVERNEGLCTATLVARLLFATRRTFPTLFDTLAHIRRPSLFKRTRRRDPAAVPKAVPSLPIVAQEAPSPHANHPPAEQKRAA